MASPSSASSAPPPAEGSCRCSTSESSNSSLSSWQTCRSRAGGWSNPRPRQYSTTSVEAETRRKRSPSAAACSLAHATSRRPMPRRACLFSTAHARSSAYLHGAALSCVSSRDPAGVRGRGSSVCRVCVRARGGRDARERGRGRARGRGWARVARWDPCPLRAPLLGSASVHCPLLLPQRDGAGDVRLVAVVRVGAQLRDSRLQHTRHRARGAHQPIHAGGAVKRRRSERRAVSRRAALHGRWGETVRGGNLGSTRLLSAGLGS